MRKIYFIVFILISMGFASCEYTPYEQEKEPEVSDDLSFKADVEPIFTEAGCAASTCHGGNKSPELTTGNAYDGIMSEPRFIDLEHENNIYSKAKQGNGHYKTYTPEQAAKVKKWIENEAPNN